MVAGIQSDSSTAAARATGSAFELSQPNGARPSHASSNRAKPGMLLAAMVRIGPAAIRFTRMCRGPSSRARYRDVDSKPALATPIQS